MSWDIFVQDLPRDAVSVEEEVRTFAFHVRGGDAAAGVVGAILEGLKLRALDSQTGGFFVAGPEAVESFRKWCAYRDSVIDRS